MESNIGEDINEAHNGLGEAIAEANNANSQGIIDTQNTMSDQHSKMIGLLYESLCLIYEAVNGTCILLIGPLHGQKASQLL